MNEKDIKREIRQLKKLKRACRAGSDERLELYRKIKELQAQLDVRVDDSKEKKPIIAEILKLDKVMASIEIDLTKHSVAELEKYLKKLKEKT